MTDAFATLGIPRRLAWTDDDLRQAFRDAGKSAHPDAGGTGPGFQTLQEALGLLSSPSRRLKHWLQLREIPGDDRGTLGADLMDAFSQIGTILQDADALIRKREAAQSALAKAMLEGATQLLRERIETGQAALESLISLRLATFDSLEAGVGDPWQVVRDLAFLEKWQAQLRERYGRLW
jgi:curved DNA-binding protein CbpA